MKIKKIRKKEENLLTQSTQKTKKTRNYQHKFGEEQENFNNQVFISDFVIYFHAKHNIFQVNEIMVTHLLSVVFKPDKFQEEFKINSAILNLKL